MPVIYSDNEIAQLLAERKPLPSGWRESARLRSKRGHSERELDISGADGGEFRLILRLNSLNSLDFSVILAVMDTGSNRLFRLRRHNGKSHQHTNRIEGDTFYDFHIHMATERYQSAGGREDEYAEVTDKYSDFHGALERMIKDANFEIPEGDQLSFP